MAEIIHCPCGQAIEFSRTDVLETIDCPVCRRELVLDLQSDGQRRRAFLTVVAGPDRVGEQIIVPVGHDLRIGSAHGAWLYLLHDSVAPHHCSLMLDPTGQLVAFSPQATPDGPANVNQYRIAIRPGQLVRIGDFHLRFAIGAIEQPRAMTAPAAAAPPPPPPTPILKDLSSVDPVSRFLIRHRFRLARIALFCVAVLLAVFHGFHLAYRDEIPWYYALAACAAIFGGLVALSRTIGLTRRAWNLAVILIVLLAAAVESYLGQIGLMVGLLILTAGLILAVERPPSQIPLWLAVGLMLLAMLTMTASLVRPGGPVFDVNTPAFFDLD
jgi:hypothetical protein